MERLNLQLWSCTTEHCASGPGEFSAGAAELSGVADWQWVFSERRRRAEQSRGKVGRDGMTLAGSGDGSRLCYGILCYGMFPPRLQRPIWAFSDLCPLCRSEETYWRCHCLTWDKGTNALLSQGGFHGCLCAHRILCKLFRQCWNPGCWGSRRLGCPAHQIWQNYLLNEQVYSSTTTSCPSQLDQGAPTPTPYILPPGKQCLLFHSGEHKDPIYSSQGTLWQAHLHRMPLMKHIRVADPRSGSPRRPLGAVVKKGLPDSSGRGWFLAVPQSPVWRLLDHPKGLVSISHTRSMASVLYHRVLQ